MLNEIHGNAHLGIVKSKRRARRLLYWPKMNEMLENFIKKYKLGEIYQRSISKEPMISHDLPNLPFEMISIDIAEYGEMNYLVVKDFLSKWIDIIPIINKTIDNIVSKLKIVFQNMKYHKH